MSKSQVRKNMAELLGRLSAAEIGAQSRQLLERLVQHPRYKAARRISIYLSQPAEADTIELLRLALEAHQKDCFVPYVASHSGGQAGGPRMRMLRLASMEDYQRLPRNRLGIKEPSGELASQMRAASPSAGQGEPLDLALVPGVAFCADGRRLGHGKGYYDEFLADWAGRSPSGRLYTIGLALREQLLAELPVEPADYWLDEVLHA